MKPRYILVLCLIFLSATNFAVVDAEPATARTVSFLPTQTSSEFLALLADESIDVIELNGTYHLPEIDINIDRTRPVVVRPAAGATVVMSGAASGGNPQLMFGYDGPAGNITMQNLIFDGYILRKQGIVQGFDCHDITLNDMVVRNSRADGTYAQPYHSWAIYLVADATHYPVNFTANRWTVDVVDRQMCGVKICGGSHVTLSDWSISHAYFAVYGGGSRGPLSDFVLDDWTINDVGGPDWGSSNISVGIADASGRYSNINLVSSGEIIIDGTPRMTDGGGNVRIASFSPEQNADQFLSLLANESINVIEMTDGIYHLPNIHIDVDRVNPIVIRPAAGATVILSGKDIKNGAGQFEIGDHGRAGNITMQGFTFDGYVLQQIGIFHIFNAHDIALNSMVVRNCRSNGTSALPYHSWAVYITSTTAVIPTNITANNWTVDGSTRQMSALQVCGGKNIVAKNWQVSNACFAIYANSARGPLTGLTIVDWTIKETYSKNGYAIYCENAAGQYGNIHLLLSGDLTNLGMPHLTEINTTAMPCVIVNRRNYHFRIIP